MNGKSIDDILRASDLSQFLAQAQSDNTNVEVGMSMRANNTPAQLTMSQARPVIVAPGLGLLEFAGLGATGSLGKTMAKSASRKLSPSEIGKALKQFGGYDEKLLPTQTMAQMKRNQNNFFEELEDAIMSYQLYSRGKAPGYGYSQKKLKDMTLEQIKAMLGY